MPLDMPLHLFEDLDAALDAALDGSPLLIALGVALSLGLRHASDPDHLVAVTALMAAGEGDTRSAARLGASWGAGHALALIAIGLPLIALRSRLPGWLETGAETAVGVVIVVLALRVIAKWARGRDRSVRTHEQAFGLGALHGLAGTGAVVLLLVAALPTPFAAAAALAVFAPASIVSMTLCTSAFAWVLARPAVQPVYRTVLVPTLGLLGLAFGLWYAGIT